MSAAQLSFPASQVAKIAALDGVKDAAGSLTLNAITIKGTVPEGGLQGPQVQRNGPPANGGSQPQTQRAPFDVDSISVTGRRRVQARARRRRRLHAGDAREAVVNESYAKRHGISVGESLTLDGKKFKVIGLADSPLGGQASDVYIKLAQLRS